MMLTTRPQRRARIPSTTRRIARMKPNSLVSSWPRSPSSVIAAKRPEYIWPALFTRMSTAPNRSLARRARRSTSAATAMSATTASTSPPVFATSSSRACSSVASVRAQIVTRAPASSSFFAISRPMPRAPPVTMALRPWIPRSMVVPPSDGCYHRAHFLRESSHP